MIRNYFKTAIRNLFKYRSYSILNILGLSVGLACFAQIGLWVKNELTYDRFHTQYDRIYRVAGIFSSESDQSVQAVTPTPLAQALRDDYPEVITSVRLDNNDAIVKNEGMEFMEDHLIMTDPSFFEVFDFRMISGDQKTALLDPYSIVLSNQMAIKYFGNANPVGQTLKIFLQDPDGKGKDYKITGIIADCPDNSHFKYQALISFSTYEVNNPASPEGYDWFNNGYYTYILLSKGSSAFQLESKFPQLVEKYMGVHTKEWNINYEYFLQPLSDIHLFSDIKYEIKETSSLSTVIIFGSIGFMVLILACINYVNLSTSFSAKRFKEVGMRKVMGARRNQLIGQYITESWILVIISLFLAYAWIEVTRPLFESLTGSPIVGLYTATSLFGLFGIATLVGILAGAYPAFLLSSLRPTGILKGSLTTGGSESFLRKGLVSLQYVVTIILISGILVVHNQLDFMRTQDVGYNHKGLIVLGVNGSEEVISGYAGFANSARTLSLVEGISRSNTTLAGGLNNSIAEYNDASGKLVNGTIYRVRVDHDYLDVHQMQLLAGRFFVKENAADSTKSFVVNEAMARNAGFSNAEEMIGNPFRFQGNDGEVIGVIKDFHYNSLKYSIEPTCLRLLRNNFSRITIRMADTSPAAINEVRTLWKTHFPNTLFDFQFAEETLNNQYKAEQRFEKIFFIFSALSLMIACLGLYALVSFSMESRVKEIGIRKVLGASVISIQGLVSKEFMVLIFCASIVAIPAAYYLMGKWLEGFNYKMQLGPAVFIISFSLVFIIAFITVSLKSIRASLANPVKSIRNE